MEIIATTVIVILSKSAVTNATVTRVSVIQRTRVEQ